MTSLLPADLTVVIPTYNERDRLAELVTRLFDASAQARVALELVIVDDNSPDGTGALADDLAKLYRLRVVHRAGKLGLGTAVVAGFGVAGADIVGVMDADFSHPPALVTKMLARLRDGRGRGGREPVRARRQHARLALQTPAALTRGLPARPPAVADPRRRVGLLPDPPIDRAARDDQSRRIQDLPRVDRAGLADDPRRAAGTFSMIGSSARAR